MVWGKPSEHLTATIDNSGFSKNYNYLISVSYYIRVKSWL